MYLIPLKLPNNQPLDCSKYDTLRDKINELIDTIQELQQKVEELEERNQ